jgi:proteasome accessory factor C
MAVAHGHIPRLLHLVRLLEKRGERTVADAASALGISERDIEDDVRLLSTCGLPPYTPADLFEIEIENGVIRLGARLLDVPRLQLTAEEVAGLRLAARYAENQGWGESRTLRRALGKLEAALLPAERERGRKLARRLGVPRATPIQVRTLAALERAVRDRREVEITYFTEATETSSRRRVHPYSIVAAPEGSYLVGHDSRRDAVITFRVDHILRLRPTPNRFEPPPGFDPRPYVDWRTGGHAGRVSVRLRFDPSVTALARDTFPNARALTGGAVEVRLEVWPGASFSRYVLSWGGACEVVEPESMREAIAAYAREVASAHAGAAGRSARLMRSDADG